MVFLIFVAISMLSRVEATFNDIWGVTRGRNWLVRVVQYWAAITLGPLLLLSPLGLAGGPHLQATGNLISKMPVIGSFIFDLLPLLLLWLTFALLYQLGPNTRVRFQAALVGGILAGSLWHLNNLIGFVYVSRVVTNSRIYGSLGLLPVFMAGLYLSWLILLFGAQVTYAFQNRESYLQQKAGRKREPTRARIRRAALDDLHRAAVSAGPAASDASGNLERAGHSDAAHRAGVGDARAGAACSGSFRRGAGVC